MLYADILVRESVSSFIRFGSCICYTHSPKSSFTTPSLRFIETIRIYIYTTRIYKARHYYTYISHITYVTHKWDICISALRIAILQFADLHTYSYLQYTPIPWLPLRRGWSVYICVWRIYDTHTHIQFTCNNTCIHSRITVSRSLA